MIIVQKFGGTSIGSKQRIKSLKNIIKKYKLKNIKLVIILSAMSGETQKMINLAKYFRFKKNKELDSLLSTGEQMSVSLFNIYLNSLQIDSKSITSSQLGFLTNNDYSNARILNILNLKLLNKLLKKKKIPILTGFQGITTSGNLTTLGRGGSDTSAIIIAAVLKAKECQIFTDVNAIFFSDPRICKNFRIKFLTFESMLELSSSGSKILYVRSIEIAKKYNVNIRILSSFSKKGGTFVSFKKKINNSMERLLISGISYTTNEVRLTLINIPNIPGIASKIIGPIISNKIKIDLISQNTILNYEFTNFTFLIEDKSLKKAIFLLNNHVITKLGGEIEFEFGISKISIIGIGLRSHNNTIGKILYSMSKLSVNVILISTSETKISILIKKFDTIKVIKLLYKIFNN